MTSHLYELELSDASDSVEATPESRCWRQRSYYTSATRIDPQKSSKASAGLADETLVALRSDGAFAAIACFMIADNITPKT